MPEAPRLMGYTMSAKKAFAAAAVISVLAACASLNNVESDVTSFSQWPTGRSPGSYRFERLPSQLAQADAQARLEDAARAALASAGFSEATASASTDVTVQLGARVTRYDRSPWADPLWRGHYGFGWWGARSPWWGVGLHYDASPRYDREVGVLIRDGKTGNVLYESRAANEGGYSGDAPLLAAMFEAALKDFPQPAVSPRRVTIPLAKP